MKPGIRLRTTPRGISPPQEQTASNLDLVLVSTVHVPCSELSHLPLLTALAIVGDIWGFAWEADAVARSLRDGKLESEHMPLSETLLMMEVSECHASALPS